MNVTDNMLQAAISKAIEAGLLPRHPCREEAKTNAELMRLVVQAALSALPEEPRQVLCITSTTYKQKKKFG